MKTKLLSELIPRAEAYLSNKGYGRGTNYTTSHVASLLAQFALEVINSDAPTESRNVATHEAKKEECQHAWIHQHQMLEVCSKCGKKND